MRDGSKIHGDAERGHGHAQHDVGDVHQLRSDGRDKGHEGADDGRADEAEHEPGEGNRAFAGGRHGGMMPVPPDGDDDGREHEHEYAGELHDGGDVDGAERGACGHGMRDLMQGRPRGDAQLRGGKPRQGAEHDFRKREYGAHDGDDGHGHDLVVRFFAFHGAHDGDDGHGHDLVVRFFAFPFRRDLDRAG